MLLLAFGQGQIPPRAAADLLVPVRTVLCVLGVAFLVGFRVGLERAHELGQRDRRRLRGGDRRQQAHPHGQPLYGHFPEQQRLHGDTYGPVNYYAYVPFTAIFGWRGTLISSRLRMAPRSRSTR